MTHIRLVELATARSGDKGDCVDISVFARNERVFDWLQGHLTPEQVAAHFAPLGVSRAEVWPLANLRAFKFLLHGALPGGAARTLREDNLGKSWGAAALRMPLPAPPAEVLEGLKK